jgi:predicted TIM-barrel fold metal-dependent hydrolase
MTENALKTLLSKLPTSDLVWGGDWNHSLIGKEHAGSMGGRNHLLEAVKQLELNVS